MSDETPERNIGCFTLVMMFLMLMIVGSNIGALTKQVKRIADKMEQVR